MNCESCQALLAELLNPRVQNDARWAEAREHARLCRDCERAYAVVLRGQAGLALLRDQLDREHVPDSIVTTLRAAFASQQGRQQDGRRKHMGADRRARRLSRFVPMSALLAASVAIIAVTWTWRGHWAALTDDPASYRAAFTQPAAPAEIASPFYAVNGGTEGITQPRMIRLQTSRTAMLALGLPVNPDRLSQPITADLVLDESGTVRAVRFVQ